jgi:hypothetical protein
MSASVFISQRVQSRFSDRAGRTLSEPRTCPEPHDDLAEVAVKWDDGETADVLTDDLRFLGEAPAEATRNERRPVAHPDYTLSASELAKLLTGDLAELPAVALTDFLAPVARQQMRELADKMPLPVRKQAETFWRRLDAYCEAEVREREEASDPGVTIKASDLQEGHEVKAEGAPAWSKIRTLYSEGSTIEAVFDWGRIAYAPTEDVNVRVAEPMVEAAAMSTSDGLGR